MLCFFMNWASHLLRCTFSPPASTEHVGQGGWQCFSDRSYHWLCQTFTAILSSKPVFFSAIRLSPSERLFHTWRKQQLFYRSNWQPCGLGSVLKRVGMLLKLHVQLQRAVAVPGVFSGCKGAHSPQCLKPFFPHMRITFPSTSSGRMVFK